ncbi:MAG: hypothetical protein FJY55_08370 [Betaproteobacteria bacterium]|nr:hypothetical protein [Betaproteobacteria bacterium]
MLAERVGFDSLPIQERCRRAECHYPAPFLLMSALAARAREEAFATYEKYFAAEQRFYYRHGIFPASKAFPTESSVTAENLAKYYVVGSPQDCIESMRGFREKFGVDEVDIRIRVPLGPSFAEARDAIQMFGKEVIPRVR